MEILRHALKIILLIKFVLTMDEVTFNLYVNDLQGMFLSLLHVTDHGSILDFDKPCVTAQELHFFPQQ